MARTGRGWDAKPPAPRRKTTRSRRASASAATGDDAPSSGWDTEAVWEADPRTAGATPAAASRAEAGGDRGPDQPLRGLSLPWTDKPDGGGSALRGSSRRRGGRGGDESAGEGRGWGGSRSSRAARAGADDTPDEQRDPYEVAREICLRQLAARPRTRAELATVLKKRGVAEEVSRTILERYAEVGMIDDTAFAKAWVTSRHHSKGLASRALAQELRQRGVEQQAVTEALSEIDPETEAQTALELAMRKLRTTRGEPDAVFRKLVGMLARKGYPGGVAMRAVKEALATRDAEMAELIDPDAFEE